MKGVPALLFQYFGQNFKQWSLSGLPNSCKHREQFARTLVRSIATKARARHWSPVNLSRDRAEKAMVFGWWPRETTSEFHCHVVWICLDSLHPLNFKVNQPRKSMTKNAKCPLSRWKGDSKTSNIASTTVDEVVCYSQLCSLVQH